MVRELSTIQKNNKLNRVFSTGNKGSGGAFHNYEVIHNTKDPAWTDKNYKLKIHFQEGARFAPKSTSGVLDCDLLEIVRDRLTSFQAGEYATKENGQALVHIEEALMWMNKRVEDRAERNVLGTYNK